jgi:hypothetical protein
MDFFFSWSEMGYKLRPWVYIGLSAQQNYVRQDDQFSFDPGVVVGFEIRKWTFPIYGYNINHDQRYFVFGINIELGSEPTKNHRR